ncbi:MAG: hypothetical protein J7K21_00960 [Desulfurococcales archaeon]|nr:hypothetical protein [Desulfurococcales archaeon]
MVKARIWLEDLRVQIDYEDLKIFDIGTIYDKVTVCFSRDDIRLGITVALSIEEAKELVNKMSEKIEYLEKLLNK